MRRPAAFGCGSAPLLSSAQLSLTCCTPHGRPGHQGSGTGAADSRVMALASTLSSTIDHRSQHHQLAHPPAVGQYTHRRLLACLPPSLTTSCACAGCGCCLCVLSLSRHLSLYALPLAVRLCCLRYHGTTYQIHRRLPQELDPRSQVAHIGHTHTRTPSPHPRSPLPHTLPSSPYPFPLLPLHPSPPSLTVSLLLLHPPPDPSLPVPLPLPPPPLSQG